MLQEQALVLPRGAQLSRVQAVPGLIQVIYSYVVLVPTVLVHAQFFTLNKPEDSVAQLLVGKNMKKVLFFYVKENFVGPAFLVVKSEYKACNALRSDQGR